MPLSFKYSRSLIKQDPNAITHSIDWELAHINSIIIELYPAVCLLSQVSPLIFNELTLWLVILDLTQLLLTGYLLLRKSLTHILRGSCRIIHWSSWWALTSRDPDRQNNCAAVTQTCLRGSEIGLKLWHCFPRNFLNRDHFNLGVMLFWPSFH